MKSIKEIFQETIQKLEALELEIQVEKAKGRIAESLKEAKKK